MFSRVSALLAVAIAVTASARMERLAHARRNVTSTGGECNVGAIHCCESLVQASDAPNLVSKLSDPFALADTIGISCTPLNWGGAGESAVCEQEPVCCQNNTYSGDFSVFVACSPVNTN